MDDLRCPICRRPHEQARDLVWHILNDHPMSDTAVNIKIELAFIEAKVEAS